MYIEWYIQTVQHITRTFIHKNQFISLCRGQKPASKCIRLVYEILVRCRALQALYTPQRCELMKTKTNNINCSYRIFIVCRSPVSPVFWARILLTNFCLSRVRVHRFRDNAITGDIPLISPVLGNQWYPLSTWYRMSGTSGIYYFWLPDRLCSSPPLLGFYWNRWGGGDSVASGLNAYNLQTTLIQYDSIYTKIWARSWKHPVPRPRW